jgi:hypothetical protein
MSTCSLALDQKRGLPRYDYSHRGVTMSLGATHYRKCLASLGADGSCQTSRFVGQSGLGAILSLDQHWMASSPGSKPYLGSRGVLFLDLFHLIWSMPAYWNPDADISYFAVWLLSSPFSVRVMSQVQSYRNVHFLCLRFRRVHDCIFYAQPPRQ